MFHLRKNTEYFVATETGATILLSAIFLGTRPVASDLLGAALIAVGLLMVSAAKYREERQTVVAAGGAEPINADKTV